MDGNHKDLFSFIYKTFCLIGAIITASWCCFEYSKNEDICDVYFKRFLEDEESVYPEMTIVVPQQFNETKLQTLFGKNMTSPRLRQILIGEDWDDRVLDTNMEDIRLNLNEYMLSHGICFSIYEPCYELDHIIAETYMGQDQIKVHFPPGKQVMLSSFIFSTSVFPNGLSPDLYDLIVAFQYPNSIYRAQGSFFNVVWSKPKSEEIVNKRVHFALKNMEVVRKRDKSNRKCVNLENYDASLKESIYLEIGCRPHYVNSSKVKQICNSQNKTKELAKRNQEAFFRLPNAKNDVPPCKEIQKLQVEFSMKTTNMTYSEENPDMKKFIVEKETTLKSNDTWFEIVFEIQTDTFKEIKQKRAYSEQSLIGNLGGYLGIFIGFSLLDLLTALLSLRIKIQNTFGVSLDGEKRHSDEEIYVTSGKAMHRKCLCIKLMEKKLANRSLH